ncbi:MAG: alkaline phosphatase family protein [Planctomycetota bacterium]|nr:alkaline phosphatase family protein [Planctomycetota bacterium]
MQSSRRPLRLTLGMCLALSLTEPALAYIGPGAGFAAAGSLLVLLGTFALAFGIIMLWPLKVVIKVFSRRGKGKAKVKRVVIVGLDGFDPGLAKQYMDEGKMPNFKKLAEAGHFSPLGTAMPSISPVAWSTFATGVDASRHNIYDFLTRDPCSYMPVLSSTDTRTVPRTLNLGFAKVPFGQRAVYKILQRSQPFWKLLGQNHVWSSILRVPITFPPQKFKNGTLLSGMCVPDLQGTQGSFSFYSTKDKKGAHIGGQQFRVVRRGNRIESALKGPPGKDGHALKCPFTVELDDAARKAKITVASVTVEVGFQEYTPWLEVPFDGVTGIARIYLQDWDERDVGIYVTPINIDPESPAMPISHPFVYSIYLAKMMGKYATLGLAEDTWALNERVIDEKAFLDQAWLIFEERKQQLWDALDKTKRGLVTCVFDTTDRISHMFYRYLDPDHPANEGKDTEKFKNVIPELYAKMDAFLPEMMEKVGMDDDTVFMVISDHGFCNFTRGVNLNSWLRDEGYLVLKDGKKVGADWFMDVDWAKTRAFTLGLTGVFINRKGRERNGIVEPGEEVDKLTLELKRKLEKLVDPKTGNPVINECFVTKQVHDGPYADLAPELLIGYHRGFRHSWDCATGAASEEIFTDNTKSWSGDHCVDPRLVPGSFWCNRKVNTEEPALSDMAPTVLDLFGVEIPGYMLGAPLFGERTKRTRRSTDKLPKFQVAEKAADEEAQV